MSFGSKCLGGFIGLCVMEREGWQAVSMCHGEDG